MTWKTVRMNEYFRVKHGYAFKGTFFDSDGPFVLLTPGSFNEEGGFRDQGERTKYYTGDVPEGFVLDEGDFQEPVVGGLAAHRRDARQAGQLRGAPAALPGDQAVGAAFLADDHRLDDAVLPDAARQPFEIGEVGARLVPARMDPVDVQHQQAGLAVGERMLRDEAAETFAECLSFHDDG